MPALNFKKQFAAQVELGVKRQTIRRKRTDNKDPKQGDTLYLYSGMRTKNCMKLGEAICKSSVPILIDADDIIVGGDLLCWDEQTKLAEADGFETVSDFKAFFLNDYVLQFEGKLIKW